MMIEARAYFGWGSMKRLLRTAYSVSPGVKGSLPVPDESEINKLVYALRIQFNDEASVKIDMLGSRKVSLEIFKDLVDASYRETSYYLKAIPPNSSQDFSPWDGHSANEFHFLCQVVQLNVRHIET